MNDPIIELLDRLESVFAERYENISVNGNNCFVAEDGTVFYFIVFTQFRSLVIEYADDIAAAVQDRFDDGDQIDIDQEFDALVSDICMQLDFETGKDECATIIAL